MQLLLVALFLQTAQMINKDDAVQMIDFMLHTDREKPFTVTLEEVALQILGAHGHL